MDPSLQDVYQEIIRMGSEVAETNALVRESMVKVEYHETAIEEHRDQIRDLNETMSYVKGAAGVFGLLLAWMGAKLSGLKFW